MPIPFARMLCGIVLCGASVTVWAAGQVTVSGQLTSFQSALSRFDTGNGTLDGMPLVIDAAAPFVTYPGSTTRYRQSTSVTLAPGTQQVQFEYTDFIGGPDAQPNVVSFQAAAPSMVNVGEVFKVGTLSYTNGFWYPFARIGLSIDVASAVPSLDKHSFQGSIIVAVSSPEPYLPDPVSNADYFYLEDASGPLTSMGSVRVYELDVQPPGNPGNTGTVDLYARIGSLVPTRFDNPSAGAFLSASLAPLPAVPEPSTHALMLGGLAMLGWLARRRAA